MINISYVFLFLSVIAYQSNLLQTFFTKKKIMKVSNENLMKK